jgi:hypothetical protein
MKMLLLARTIAVLSGICLLGILLWLVWQKWSLPIIPKIILSAFGLWICFVIGGLVGEHLLNFLSRRKK